jgi:hypothetical protein
VSYVTTYGTLRRRCLDRAAFDRAWRKREQQESDAQKNTSVRTDQGGDEADEEDENDSDEVFL